MPTKEQVAQAVILSRRQEDEGCTYYVIWISPGGVKYWSGPYPTEEEANTATAVCDSHQVSQIIRGERV